MNKSKRLLGVLVVFFAVGCADGVEACEAYNEAMAACYDEMGMDAEHTADCTDAPKDAIERYDCLTDLYDSSECSSAETMPSEEDANACG